MFAGPNGSGKSTLIEEISRHFNMGYFVLLAQVSVFTDLPIYVTENGGTI